MSSLNELLKRLDELEDPGTRSAVRELLGQMITESDPPVTTQEHVESLLEAYRRYLEQDDLRPGDLVVWKPGLKNRVRPRYDEPAVIIEVLDPPVVDAERGSGTQYFREPLGLKLGLLDAADELIMFHFERNRFTKYVPDDLQDEPGSARQPKLTK